MLPSLVQFSLTLGIPQGVYTESDLGLGAMGYAMAKNIRKKMLPTGTLYIFDVFRSACERFYDEMQAFGPTVIADSPREAAELSGTVISIVPGADEVRQVFLDATTGIIVARSNPERLILECSTIDSHSTRAVGEALLVGGAGTYVDTPVSVCLTRVYVERRTNQSSLQGGVPGAELGTLSFLIGHSKPSDADPISYRLEKVASMMGDPNKFFYCGKLVAGLAAKISNNYLSCSILLAVAEAMAIGTRSGIDEKLLHQVIHHSTGQNFMADNVQPVPGVVLDAPSSNDYRLGFRTQMMIKDLGLGVQAGYATGIKPTIAEAALRVYEKAAVDPRCIVSNLPYANNSRN
jgi:3-hydroxyisobutyrate dehydrogenase-like beta-hydroxyacid dehydrogenase